MDKKNKICLILLIILTVGVVAFCIYSILVKSNIEESDAIKFRNEYMELNDTVASGNETYLNVTISESNTVQYVTLEKAISLIKNGRGVIYFGFPTCPWCRTLVGSLTKIAEEEEETIYYVNIKDVRSSFTLEDGKVNKLNDGTEEYYELLELLDGYLEEFILEDEAGNQYKTGETRIYAPTIVAFNEGKITGFHEGTVASQISGYDKLTSDQTEELEKIITEILASLDSDTCGVEHC